MENEEEYNKPDTVITDENRGKWIAGLATTAILAIGYALLMYFLDLGRQQTLQITNVVTYIVCLAANGASQKIMSAHSLRKISN